MKYLLLIPLSIILFGCPKSTEVEPDESITIGFTSPVAGQSISNNTEIPITAKPSGEIKKIEYFLDGVSIGSVISDPYTLKWTPKDIIGGDHIITAVAISSKNNEFKSEQKILIKLNLGDEFKGGKIFQLTGVNSGLISSIKDLQVGSAITFTWGPSGTLIGANSNSGKENTAKIAAVSTTENQSAYHFKSGYQYNGFNDWYIPSFEEINILKENANHVGGFEKLAKDATYWTSSENSPTQAHIQNMIALIGTPQLKGAYAYRIRPIRKF